MIPIEVQDTIKSIINAKPEITDYSWLDIYNEYVRFFYYIMDKQTMSFERIARPNALEMDKDFRMKRGAYKSTYSKILKDMLRHQLIQKCSKYVVGERNNGYIVNPLIDFMPIVDFLPYVKPLELSKLYKENHLETYPSYEKLINSEYKMGVDVSGFKKYITENLGIYLSTKKVNGTNAWKDIYLTPEKCFHSIYIANKILEKDLHFSYSGGRIYTLFTQSPKILRRFITFNNQKLVEIDIRNCFPLLLNLFVKDEHFKHDCERGLFYERICEYTDRDRNMIKQDFSAFIMQKTIPKKTYLTPLLEHIYPSLVEQINQQRPLLDKLHPIETDIITHSLLKTDLPFLQIHDGVYTTEKYITGVKNVLCESFNQKGLNPIIDIVSG
jgi:hypothetical protein